MRDLCLQVAGAIAIVTAVGHGVVGELVVFSRSPYPGEGTRRLLRLIWQASSVDWIVIGVLLILAPSLDSPLARAAIVTAASIVYGYAALGNAIATGGAHVGWVLMCVAVVLALLGQ